MIFPLTAGRRVYSISYNAVYVAWAAKTTTGEWKILHSHYTKEVSSRQVMHRYSSHGERMKKNVMINEMDRIMRNCSPHLTWNKTIIPSVKYYVKRMLYSGYSKFFIYGCLSIALKSMTLG